MRRAAGARLEWLRPGGRRCRRAARDLAASGHFDPTFYLRVYRDVAEAGHEPHLHYAAHGWREGRWPNPAFDGGHFLAESGPRPTWHRLRRALAADAAAPEPVFCTPPPLAAWQEPLLSAAAREALAQHFARYALTAAADPWSGEPTLGPAARGAARRRMAALAASLPKSRQPPELSIVVPVFEQERLTLSCLEALLRWPPGRRFEILVVDDASPSGYLKCLHGLPGVRLLGNARNLGYLESCNIGAAAAAGRYLCLLNNDTVVLPDALDRLVDCLEAVPEAGLVGARLLFPDGRLQEAGGVIWEDASGWNLGRGQDAWHPDVGYRRDVDYCSGAAIALPLALWQRLGGYDPRYRPAYYEDTDLAFRVRQAGRRVLYQPLAAVIHFESASSQGVEGGGMKRHQAVNRAVFHARWAETLRGHGTPGEPPRHFRDRTRLGQILVCDALTPTPDLDSGSLDCVVLLRQLQELGFAVTYLPQNAAYCGSYTQALQGAGVRVLHAPHVGDYRAALADLAPELDAAILSRVAVAEESLQAIRQANPRCRVVFNTVDLHHLRMERAARLAGDPVLLAEAVDLERRERAVIRAADATLVVSSAEQQLLRLRCPGARVVQHPLVREIPGRGPAGHGARDSIVFLGGFGHPPNIDAVEWFLAEVWPLAAPRLPALRLVIAGAKMPPIPAAATAPRVELRGYVDDLTTLFAGARVSIAPLRYGAGQKGKVVAALSHGVPVVLTAIAAEGMGLSDGRDAAVADSPADFAERLVALCDDPALWNRLSVAGLAHAAQHFSLERGRARLFHLLRSLGLRPRAGDLEERWLA